MSVSLGSVSDRDIVECLQNCPQLDDPLFDENVLNELCLSDELWANLNFPIPAMFGQDESSDSSLSTDIPETMTSVQSCPGYGNQMYLEVPGLTTPPQSPPTLCVPSSTSSSSSPSVTTSSTAPPSSLNSHQTTLSSSTTTSSSSATSSSLSVTSELPRRLPVQPLMRQTKEQQQQQQHRLGAVSPASLPQFTGSFQILKSGEVVCLPQLPGLLQQVAQPAVGNKARVKQEAPTACTGQKRPHPDSNTASIADNVDMSKLSKKQQRMIKNRESACISRQKKRQYVDSLEARLKDAAQKNSTLLQENTSLRKQVSLLEKENVALRLSQSRPSSPTLFSPMKKPATAIMAVAILFLSLSAVFLYPRDQDLSSPTFPLTRTSTALMSVKSRALLSIDPSDHSYSSGVSSRASLGDRTRDRPPASRNALIPGEQVARRWGEKKFGLRGFVGGDDGTREEASTVGRVCSCPLDTRNDSMRHNLSNIQTINKNMMSCFEVEPAVPTHDSVRYTRGNKDQNSLTVVSTGYPMHTTDYMFQGAESLYREFKKFIPRNLENYYLLTFKDHVLLQPTMGNASQLPMLSVFIPADPEFNSLLQIDCEVVGTKIISTGGV